MNISDSQVRVKVYQHEEGPDWKDIGTGFCTLEDYQGVLHLNVVSEHEPNRIILDCIVQHGEVYQHQESTQIVWTEPTGEDIALSFENQEGCLSILNQITEFETALKEQQELERELDQGMESEQVAIPSPSMDTLSEIGCIIAEAGQSSILRDKLVALIIDSDYIGQLQELHEVCEDLDATEALHVIYDIVKHIILLNSSSLFEHIIREDIIVGIAAMLEYDPDHPVERGTFRDFLRDSSRYKQVVPIKDPVVQEKIHQTFRLQYLKDAVLLHILDDGTLPVINTLIFFNHAQIVSHIQGNHALLADLFSILEDPSADESKKRDVVLFVHQLGNLARNLPGTYKIGLYRTLSQHGIFLAFEYALQAKHDSELQSAGVDILLSILEHDRALVRLYILEQAHSQQNSASDLFQLLLAGTKKHIGSNYQVLCCEIVRALLETVPPSVDVLSQQVEIITATSEGGKDTEDFLALFYNSYAPRMMAPLICLSPQTMALVDAGKKDSGLLMFLCETLSTMVRRHGYRARSFVFSSNISKSVCMLLAAKHGHLKLAALRFIRSCIGLHDEAYNKYFISNRLFDPIVALYVESRSRDNLIASACREFFNFIAICQIPSLLAHIVGTFAKALERAPKTLEHLRQAYNQYLENMERAKNGAGGDGLATPTVDTGKRSAVSVNMLTGRENSISGLLNGQTNNNSTSGPWGCSIADEMEDAYLESSNEEVTTEAPTTLPLTILTNRSPVAEIDDTIQSPEIDGLQNCLDIYSDAENNAPAQSGIAVIEESGMPSNLAMYHTTSHAHNNHSEVSHRGSPGEHPLPAQALIPKPKTTTNGFLKPTPNKEHNGFKHRPKEVSANMTDHIVNMSALSNTSRHTKLADAFPDRQPIGRKSLAKRPFTGRIDKRAHIKINVLSAKKTHPEPFERNIPSNPGATTPESLPFLKRQRSCNGSKESGAVTSTPEQPNPSHETYPAFQLGNGCNINSCAVSNGDNKVSSKDRSTDDGNTASSDTHNEETQAPNLGVALSYPQGTPVVGFIPRSSPESQVPSKKARTASL